MSPNHRSNRRQGRTPRGYVAELTPEGQVHKVIVDIQNMKDGNDLLSWSASARKSLAPALTVPLQIGPDASSRVHIPKLALLVASPVVCSYFQRNPSATTAKFTHANISLDAMKVIAKWLKAVCLEPEFPELAMPGKFTDALELRLTAHTLGMERYVQQADVFYAEDLDYRVPDLQEIINVVKYTRKDDDPMLVALANRLAYLCKYHKTAISHENAIAELLVDDKYARLLAAIKVVS